MTADYAAVNGSLTEGDCLSLHDFTSALLFNPEITAEVSTERANTLYIGRNL